MTIIGEDGEAMDLEIAFSQDGGACVVTLKGEVDVYTAPALRERLIEAVRDATAARSSST